MFCCHYSVVCTVAAHSGAIVTVILLLQVVPLAENFTQDYLQQPAVQVAGSAMPAAKVVTDKGLRPAAAMVADKVVTAIYLLLLWAHKPAHRFSLTTC